MNKKDKKKHNRERVFEKSEEDFYKDLEKKEREEKNLKIYGEKDPFNF